MSLFIIGLWKVLVTQDCSEQFSGATIIATSEGRPTFPITSTPQVSEIREFSNPILDPKSLDVAPLDVAPWRPILAHSPKPLFNYATRMSHVGTWGNQQHEKVEIRGLGNLQNQTDARRQIR